MRAPFLAFILPCALSVLLLTGCNPKPAPSAVTGDEAAVEDPSMLAKKGLDIGDVEYNVRLEATILETSRTPALQVEEMRSLKKDLNMVTVDVHEPAPASIPIYVRILANLNTAKQPIVLRGKVLRDTTVIGEFSTVVSSAISRTLMMDGQPIPDWAFEVDALKGLDTRPESLLIHVESEALLMPLDTDPSTLDASTATTFPTSTTMLISNPVRINFPVAGNPA